jgi:hypothetical protein
MASLDRLAQEFIQQDGSLLDNPDDPEITLNEFVLTLQKEGADVSQWDEAQWTKVLTERFGINEELVPDALENLAAWGVVDNFVWESDAEEEMWGEG